MAAEEDNPILKAVPPETDYITYLTILEYQLTKERLPSLFQVLQDDKLTENIGWDLVQMLIPMLPESKDCLDLIARKGNPREVIIRVTEYLELLTKEDDYSDDGLRTFEGEVERIHLGDMTLDGMPPPRPRTEPKVEDAPSVHDDEDSQAQAFSTLLSMLTILHPRIKTKYPSRFLATSLPAALAAYRHNISHETTLVFIDFLGKVSGRRKPSLPPRGMTDGQVPTTQAPLPDPEADALTQSTSPEERALIQRLLQAVALEICEDYVSSLDGELQGLSWSTRVRESTFPTKVLPGAKTTLEKYREDEDLKERDATMKKILELCLLLGLHPKAILESLASVDEEEEPTEEPESPKEYPTKPKDIPFSAPGSMVFLAGYQTSSLIGFQAPKFVFGDLATLTRLNACFITAEGLEIQSDVIVDALLAINLTVLSEEDLFSKASPFDEVFSYIYPLCLLSADSPDPQYRYTSHVTVTKALTSHPDDDVKLGVIKALLNTTEHGVRLLLKGSAISWLKDHIIAKASTGNTAAINDLLLIVFSGLPKVSQLDEDTIMMTIAPTLSNIATALNFYYFLASSPTLRERFQLSTNLSDSSSKITQAVAGLMTEVETLLKQIAGLDEEIREGLQGDIMSIELCMESIKAIQ